jgi:hypothetical protein
MYTCVLVETFADVNLRRKITKALRNFTWQGMLFVVQAFNVMPMHGMDNSLQLTHTHLWRLYNSP